jgi:nucleoside-diphosphate-sugar epimerase
MGKIRILAAMSISMNKISILGCGWLGLPLGVYLKSKGFTVLGSSTTPSKIATLTDAGIQPFLIRAEPELVGEGLAEFFDVPLLLINIPPRRRRDNVEEIHFAEVKNIIDTARRGHVKRIIYCSSTGVYPDNNSITTELGALSPSTGSSRAILKIENYLQAQSEIQNTILRFAGLVGGDRKAGRFLAGKKDLSNGAAPVNLVHRDDCIGIIHEVICQDAWGEIFNVCADEHPQRKDFYTQQARKQGFEPPTFLEEDKASYKIISNEKVKRRLRYEFKFGDPKTF